MLNDVIASLTLDELRERYALLCQAGEYQASSETNAIVEQQLTQLEQLLIDELPNLARQGSPDNIADILQSLKAEFSRFREFCEFPQLAQKVVVGLGGSFSSGKSSLINALVKDRQCLVTEVDPTTSLPTYLIAANSEQVDVKAINLFQRAISLTHTQFRTLTHEERGKYASQVGALLQSVVVKHPRFAWKQLALLDTPGYSNADDTQLARTDANVAKQQLNSAHYILWLVPAEKGTISEDDLKFLGSLNAHIPKLVVVSRADKRSAQDIAAICQLVAKTLTERGINVLDVLPFSARPNTPYSMDTLASYLDNWDQQLRSLAFAPNFKRQFLAYQGYLADERQQAQRLLSKFNRVLTLSDDEQIVSDIESLQRKCKADLQKFEQLHQALMQLQQRFFSGLKHIGDEVGIALPEPDAIELIEHQNIDVDKLLQALAVACDVDAELQFDPSLWLALNINTSPQQLNKLIGRDYQLDAELWQSLNQNLPLTNLDKLLRQHRQQYPSFQTLSVDLAS